MLRVCWLLLSLSDGLLLHCSFEDGLKLVKLRGESMQAAADAVPSAMVSVIGLDADKVDCNVILIPIPVQVANTTLRIVSLAVCCVDALVVRLLGVQAMLGAKAQHSCSKSALSPVVQVTELCDKANSEMGEAEGVRIANYLCNGNYAVSGSVAACEAVEKHAKSFKARMTVRLAVAGAFHTRFMQPAEEQLRCCLL